MLQQGYVAVLEAKTCDELRDCFVAFGSERGFERVGGLAVVERPRDQPLYVALDNMPVEYLQLADEPSRGQQDPVVQHCKRSSVPITWSQDTYTRRGLGSLWEEQEVHGYGHGIALALHLPHGRHFVFGVNRRSPLPDSPVELTRLVADVQLFAVHAWEAASRLLPSTAQLIDVPALTAREIECLRWTMEGKTAWEVGSILGISERTAVLHVNNAAHKLNCVSKHQAVIKAMRLGLIQ
jgi:DNA-binding CsgD family transcriptional regulator